MTDEFKSLISTHYNDVSEIDLRQEMYEFLYGATGEPARGQNVLIWKANATKRVAKYKREAAHMPEASPSINSLGSGFVHTQVTRKVWLGFTGSQQVVFPMGRTNPATTFIYCEHDVFELIRIAELSEVWTLQLDSNGEPVLDNGAYIKDIRWNIRQAYPFREQTARIEYWRLHCERQEV